MDRTPILHKAVEYGSQWANISFNAVIWAHAIAAAVAVMAGVLALRRGKGSAGHIRAGQLFVGGMLATACSGIVLDVVRLAFYVEENHTKYVGFSMPTTYPARFAFLYAACCMLYFFSLSGQSMMRGRRSPVGRYQRITSSTAYGVVLLLAGVCVIALIITRFNPWTGALWMVGTFVLMVMVNLWISRGGVLAADRHRRVLLHRINMIAMLAFGGWGVVQSFGFGVVIALRGVNDTATVYTGHLPGEYTVGFWSFLGLWSVFVMLGGYLGFRYYQRARECKNA